MRYSARRSLVGFVSAAALVGALGATPAFAEDGHRGGHDRGHDHVVTTAPAVVQRDADDVREVNEVNEVKEVNDLNDDRGVDEPAAQAAEDRADDRD
jgi:hypothetical protein